MGHSLRPTARGVTLLEALARSAGRRGCPGQPTGHPQGLLVASGRAASGPRDGSGTGMRGPRALGRKQPRRPGDEERGRALTCSWLRVARGAWVGGRLGTAPRRPGPVAPAPSTRARGAGAVFEATFCVRRTLRLLDPERGG